MLYNIQKMWSINDGVKQQCAINLLPLPDDVIHTIKDYVFYTYEQVDMRILKQRLINELQQTKKALNERKTIEKAKGIIMKIKNLSEDQAYNAMRKLAMNHNKSIAELADQIITAAEVLV